MMTPEDRWNKNVFENVRKSTSTAIFKRSLDIFIPADCAFSASETIFRLVCYIEVLFNSNPRRYYMTDVTDEHWLTHCALWRCVDCAAAAAGRHSSYNNHTQTDRDRVVVLVESRHTAQDRSDVVSLTTRPTLTPAHRPTAQGLK